MASPAAGQALRRSPLRSERLFGIDVHVVDGPGTVAWVSAAIEAGRKDLVLTPNVDHVIRYQKDPEFRGAYARAGLVLPDSTPLLWAARLLGKRLSARASDLMLDLCGLAAERAYSVYLLGGSAEVVEAAVTSLRARFPGIRIVGWHHGYFRDEDEVVGAVHRATPDLLFVGLGSPKQELWMARNGELVDHRVAVCVGGAFNYVAGRVSRAPLWVQGAGLEWFWRFAQEPRRLWRRYFVEDVAFVRLVMAEYRAGRSGHRDRRPGPFRRGT